MNFKDKEQVILNKIEEKARELIMINQDMNNPNNQEFYNSPDDVICHEFRWHQWGIITHTKMFLKYWNSELDDYSKKLLIKDKVDEYLNEKIDGESKKDLLEFSIYFHDIGKFVARKIIYESNDEISFSFKGHEQASYEVLKSKEMVEWLKSEFNLTENQIEYVAQCCRLHYELGKTRDLTKELDTGYSFEYLKSKYIIEHNMGIMNANTEYQLEIGLLFLIDSLAKTEYHIEAESIEDVERQADSIEKIVANNNWHPNKVLLIKQLPINIKTAEAYLKMWAER